MAERKREETDNVAGTGSSWAGEFQVYENHDAVGSENLYSKLRTAARHRLTVSGGFSGSFLGWYDHLRCLLLAVGHGHLVFRYTSWRWRLLGASKGNFHAVPCYFGGFHHARRFRCGVCFTCILKKVLQTSCLYWLDSSTLSGTVSRQRSVSSSTAARLRDRVGPSPSRVSKIWSRKWAEKQPGTSFMNSLVVILNCKCVAGVWCCRCGVCFTWILKEVL